MKSIPYKLALERAKEANDPRDTRLIADAESGKKSAREYLRSQYTTAKEYDTLNPRRPLNEDGPCAGYGCEANIIY